MALLKTNLNLPGQKSVYHGKVRDVYELENDLLIMVATDRISAFDVVLPEAIPHKGQVLNQIASQFLDATSHIVPNWKIATPDPVVTLGHKATPFKVEMVIRGYLAGHAWRTYKSGVRTICGVSMPDGMKENDPFSEPIITPSTKAADGDHDEDISREEIIRQGIVAEADYVQLEDFTRKLFAHGQKMANQQGLILVDTKYEFGKDSKGQIILIDEVHTPDSSRYFYNEGFAQRQREGETQHQLSKEFVRQWLMENGFQGKPGQKIPNMSSEVIALISNRYIELYENITGKTFEPAPEQNAEQRIEKNILKVLNR